VNARIRTAILISGRGSNMRALIEAARDADYPAEIVAVFSDRAGAEGLAFAANAGVPAQAVAARGFANRGEFEAALDGRLRAAGVELICLAGFMRILSPDFVERWRGRLLNIHPSLLPALRGLHTHERALDAGLTEHGCTVHHVCAELDAGPIVAQAKVRVLPGDDPQSLAARVLKEEHKLYPRALAEVASALKRNRHEAAAH
jgi:phosphoribosylglycinamide formyltransferase-1